MHDRGTAKTLEPGLPLVNSLLDRACLERGAPLFYVHRESDRGGVVPLNDLVASGMEFAYELLEREVCHRRSAFFLLGDEFVEHFTEMRFLTLLAGA